MRLIIAAIVLLIGSVFLFARLGHYALWDDEAITALTAKAVWQTGDTSARLGENIVAYRNGLLLRNMKDRATPPLQFYVAAPFLGLMGDTAIASRLPFAMAEQRQLPRLLSAAHSRYRTPHLSILLTAAVILALTLSSSFIYALTLSTITRLVIYAATCAALGIRPDRVPVIDVAGKVVVGFDPVRLSTILGESI